LIDPNLNSRWTSSQRTLLCILYRWYQRSPEDFRLVFNGITDLTLSQRQVTTQFESHLHLFGGRAFPEFKAVFDIPFDDPHGVFETLRQTIESEAARQGIELQRLQSESSTPSSSGKAAKAKSALTRHRFKTLVRRAKVRPRSPAIADRTRGVELGGPLGGYALRVGSDKIEEFVDAEEVPYLGPPSRVLTTAPPGLDRTAPSLAFRGKSQIYKSVRRPANHISLVLYKPGTIHQRAGTKNRTLRYQSRPCDGTALSKLSALDCISKQSLEQEVSCRVRVSVMLHQSSSGTLLKIFHWAYR
jgi:hypothetical protein